MDVKNGYTNALLTDLYEFTMACAYFHAGRHEDQSVFDLYFRRNPFGGEFTVFAGLSEVVRFVCEYRISEEAVDFVCATMPRCSKGFREWLQKLDCSAVKIYAIPEGTVVFPREPLIRVEGPIGICQLLESSFLNLVSYPSLVATNAARMRMAVGDEKTLVEFGMRRAQGPDGAVSASRYSYLGGFDGTSNMIASYLFDIPISGTQAHSYISSFSGLGDVKERSLQNEAGGDEDFYATVMRYRKELGFVNTHEGELAAFIAYAQAFPSGFLALVDTYDTLKSGVPNFICVALALHKAGHEPIGVRLDSGDLAHLSKEVRKSFTSIGEKYGVKFGDLKIVASNEINELTLRSLNQQGHQIDIFGVGTHLVTCQSQPSLGCVYKLVEINGQPRIKLSQDASKVTIPGRKVAYRLIGQEGRPLADLMIRPDEEPPQVGKRILCCHPYEEKKRTYVIPSEVIPLHHCVWDGKALLPNKPLGEIRGYARSQLASLRPDHLRPLNPTPYKVSISEQLYDFMHRLWLHEAPVSEMR